MTFWEKKKKKPNKTKNQQQENANTHSTLTLRKQECLLIVFCNFLLHLIYILILLQVLHDICWLLIC